MTIIRTLTQAACVALALALGACATSPAGPQRIFAAGSEVVDAETITLPERWFIYVEVETPEGDAAIRRGLSSALAIVDRKIAADQNAPLGPPILDRLRPKTGEQMAFRAGRFARREPAAPLVGVRAVKLDATDAVRFAKTGSFNASVGARRAIAQHLSATGRLPVGAAFFEAPTGPRHAIVQPIVPAPGS